MKKIFISWSKNKSKKLAKETKAFLNNIFSGEIEFFFSPEMYKGTCVDNEIHKNLLNSDKCLVCITYDNFKNPWLLYEAGVVYGANYEKNNKTIVVPILFEYIPEWSSWIDKPLNRYVPIQMQNVNKEFRYGKEEFKKFCDELSEEYAISYKEFDKNWSEYEKQIDQIIKEEDFIPDECKDIVNQIMENGNYNNFVVENPEITNKYILFYKGFKTHSLFNILINSVINNQSKYFWMFGRKNERLFSREYEYFFRFLSTDGLRDGVDFKCFFPLPNSKASIKAISKDRANTFDIELKINLMRALELKNKYGLPVEKMFRLYLEPREEYIIRLDNSILYNPIFKDSEGYPLSYTDSSFKIFSALTGKGLEAKEKFLSIWNDDKKSIPLTQETFDRIYK